MVYTSQWPITTDGSDSHGRATIPYLSSLLQEAATLHAIRLDCGYEDMDNKGLLWVLSRQWLKITEYPRWQDVIHIDTWPSGDKGISWLRDFRIRSEDGRELGIATSLWFVLDKNTRRPKPARLGLDMDVNDAERVRNGDLKALPKSEDLRQCGSARAGYFDTDVHNHINNVRYLGWMLGGMDPAFLSQNIVRELEINFLAEGFVNDEMDVMLSEPDRNELSHSLVRHSDSRELCRLKTLWETLPV